ncbi:MAG: bifunctional nuclease family protein [Chitinivibrionales bacterium]|nr:bifunctional nuclease family protein [Chitinivibrionales bacterium]
MMQVQVQGLTLSDQGFVIMLGNNIDKRVLPIFIGAPEAQAIAVALNHLEVPRPLTHDLFKSVMETLLCALTKIEIYDLVDNTFYGRLLISDGTKVFTVDCRPSDAIALALRFEAPIYVSENVFEGAAVTIENKPAEKAPAEKKAAEGAPPSLTTREMLQQKLTEAVAAEKYEEAARLRDELKKLSESN